MLAKYEELGPDSKVWIYQSDRPLNENEARQAEEYIRDFVKGWKAHQVPVKGFGAVYHNYFVVLMADESYTGVSGCSIDSSVAVIRDLEQQFGINFFDRMRLSYRKGTHIRQVHRNDIAELISKGELEEDTPVFNNLVANKADFESSWEIPLSESWAASMV